MEERLMSADQYSYDNEEVSLRPQSIEEYIGQANSKGNLRIFMEAANKRNEALDHVLLYGPPGLGKTTLAHVIANEMHGNIKVVSGPSIEKTGDLAAVLSQIEEGDVLFIDEIHRLPRIVEEMLYSAMEDYYINVVIGKDAQARSIRLDLPAFTLVGATTRAGDLSAPLRDRFGITLKLEYYNEDELFQIICRTARVYDSIIESKAARELAKRSRGTPRIANRLYRRIRDFAQYENKVIINKEITIYALNKLHIDGCGLDYIDRKYLDGLINIFNGGPVGLEALALTISEETVTLEDVNEPFLLQEGFIIRTSRGRVATDKAYVHLGVKRGGLF